ncbi:MAG TPA: DUF3795 domain-containing protein [Candidatus Syntrophosphaera sp.]|nr:DUF3795 domain-containing protein [Candidatus Syntrophosphaera sp.]
MAHKLTIDDIAYCGLNCRLCNLVTVLPDAAAKLQKIMSEDGWEHFGPLVYPEFAGFWKILSALAINNETCPLCKGGCGNPDCKLRLCAKERGLRLCAECGDYPCQPLREFYSGHYEKLAQNNERIREIGIEAWLEEQQKLVDAGRCFKDLI